MTDSTTQLEFQQPSRRQAIRLLAGGVAALARGACTPATILFRSYPEQYRPGTTATMPPPTPVFAGKPAEYIHSPDSS